MTPSATYEVSAAYCGAYARALKAAGLAGEQVRAALTPAMIEILDNPYARSWVDGHTAEGIGHAVVNVHGALALEGAGLALMVDTVGATLTPLISVVGALFGLAPKTLFSRISDLQRTSLRGVPTTWADGGPNAGTLSLHYPKTTPLTTVGPLWRGAVRYVFDVCRVEGQVDASMRDGSTLILRCSWKAR